MEELIKHVKCGDIRDGALVTAHGRMRIKDGDVFIESLQEQIEIDGKSFQQWCFGKDNQLPATHSVAQLDQEITELHQKVKELSQELTLKNRVILDVQAQVQQEREATCALHKLIQEQQAVFRGAQQELQDKQVQINNLTKQRDMEKKTRQELQDDTNKITSEWDRKFRELRANLNKHWSIPSKNS